MQREHVDAFVAFASSAGRQLEARANVAPARSLPDHPAELAEGMRRELRAVVVGAFELDERLRGIAEALRGGKP